MANNHISIDTTKPRAGELAEIQTYGVMLRQKLIQLKASMSQYGSAATGDAGAIAIINDFGAGNIDGLALEGLIASASDESTGAVTGTFIAQLLDRLG